MVCFDGRLKPSGSVIQTVAGGRGRAIARDSLRRATVPPATTRPGRQAARQPVRRATVTAKAASTAEAKGGLASTLNARAAPTAAAGRSRVSRALIAAWSRCRSGPSPARAVTAARAANAAARAAPVGRPGVPGRAPVHPPAPKAGGGRPLTDDRYRHARV